MGARSPKFDPSIVEDLRAFHGLDVARDSLQSFADATAQLGAQLEQFGAHLRDQVSGWSRFCPQCYGGAENGLYTSEDGITHCGCLYEPSRRARQARAPEEMGDDEEMADSKLSSLYTEEAAPPRVPGRPGKIPQCPTCHADMVVRVNKATGTPFYGCARFPSACRGSLNIEEGAEQLYQAGRTAGIGEHFSTKELVAVQKRLEDRLDVIEAKIGNVGDWQIRHFFNGVPDEREKMKGAKPPSAGARRQTLAVSEEVMPEKTMDKAMDKDQTDSKPRRKAVPAMDQLTSFGSAIGTGVAMGGVDKAGDIFVTIAQKMFKNSPMVTAMLADPLGREVVKFMTATTVRTTLLSAPSIVPGSEGIARAADLQITYSSAKLTSAGLSMVGTELEALAAIGKELAALPAPSQFAAPFAGERARENAR